MNRLKVVFSLIVVSGLFLAGCATPPAPAAAPPVATAPQAATAAPAPPSVQPPSPATVETREPAAVPTGEVLFAETPENEESAAEIERSHLEALAEEIGPRESGSAEERQAEEYITETLTAAGYAPEIQPFSFDTEEGETLKSANVMAVKSGLSPKEIVVGAHYNSATEGAGADDNASGVAVLLEIAQKVKNVETPYTIRFIAFGAEEEDLDGSRYNVANLGKSGIENTLAMINLDSVIGGDFIYVYGDPGPGSLRDWILAAARKSSLPLEGRTDRDMDNEDGSNCECADYYAFEKAGIPFAYFEATNWNVGNQDGWTQVEEQYGDEGEIIHTPFDTIEYIDKTFPGRIDQQFNELSALLFEALTEYQPP